MSVRGASVAFVLLVSGSLVSGVCSAQKTKSRTRPVIPYNHSRLAAPPGMVYVPGGSTIIRYNQSSTDSNAVKKVSLSSFFIDKTECTNQQFRQFTEWVIDSVAICGYLKDDSYFKEAPNADSTVKRHIDWSKVDHKKIWGSTDPDVMEKLKPMRDENGEIKKEMYTFEFKYLRAYGSNPKAKVGEYAHEVVNIYPDEKIWAKDLTNAQVDVMVENYFTTPPYDDYPVVGVTWKQARAYAYWRSATSGMYSEVADYMKYYRLVYSLPTEAQWVYAAGQDMRAVNEKNKKVPDGFALEREDVDKNDKKDNTDTTAKLPDVAAAPVKTDSATTAAAPSTPIDMGKVDSTHVDRDQLGLLENFKQDEGEYTTDGASFTLPVMAYAPNDFGIYNMVGNVAEWVIDAYSPSTFAFVSDVNPELLYDADSTDVPAMKRKVVRGGSFMSNAKALSPYARDFELQDVSHCFIGFRCVMAAPEILGKTVSTRRNQRSEQKSKN
jgi:formylglycine-generating enzyme